MWGGLWKYGWSWEGGDLKLEEQEEEPRRRNTERRDGSKNREMERKGEGLMRLD